MNQKTLEDVIKTVHVSGGRRLWCQPKSNLTNGMDNGKLPAQNIPAKQITLKKSLMHQTDYFLPMQF